MCNKVKNRMECLTCNYPYSEAIYPDRKGKPLACNAPQKVIEAYIVVHDTELLEECSGFW